MFRTTINITKSMANPLIGIGLDEIVAITDLNDSIRRYYTDRASLAPEVELGSSLTHYYDSIGAVYMNTSIIQDSWNDIANKVGMNISVFYGGYDERLFTEGINVLYSCHSADQALSFNKEYNKDGKYCIGFKTYVHNLGHSIYVCENPLKMSSLEFRTEYTDNNNEHPATKLIDIYFKKSICREDGCRYCNILTVQNIVTRLHELKTTIDNNKIKIQNAKKGGSNESITIGVNSSAFRTGSQTECSKNDCPMDEVFRTYITNLCKTSLENKQLEDEKTEKIKADYAAWVQKRTELISKLPANEPFPITDENKHDYIYYAEDSGYNHQLYWEDSANGNLTWRDNIKWVSLLKDKLLSPTNTPIHVLKVGFTERVDGKDHDDDDEYNEYYGDGYHNVQYDTSDELVFKDVDDSDSEEYQYGESDDDDDQDGGRNKFSCRQSSCKSRKKGRKSKKKVRKSKKKVHKSKKKVRKSKKKVRKSSKRYTRK